MTISRPSLRPPIRVQRPAPRIQSPRAAIAQPMASTPAKPGRTPFTWDKERRRGLIAAVVVVFALGGLLAGYGVHTQVSNAAARLEARNFEAAMTTVAALRSGTVLFVPRYGNVCQRRWIDNATWLLQDGGETPCEEAVNWHAVIPMPRYRVETRLEAIRNVFQARGAGKLE